MQILSTLVGFILPIGAVVVGILMAERDLRRERYDAARRERRSQQPSRR